jgi:putative glycosyltransferase
VVTSLYRSAGHLDAFCERAIRAAESIAGGFEVVLVNDGSPDRSLAIALEWVKRDSRVRVVDLSRHYGHYDALLTGLRRCAGDRVFLIDCDLEEAPELLSEFWTTLDADPELDLVVGVQSERRGSVWNRAAGRAFYALLEAGSGLPIVADNLVARLMTRRYVEAFTSLPERPISFDALAGATGFRWAELGIAKPVSSPTTYTLRNKLRLVGESLAAYARWWPMLAGIAAAGLVTASAIVALYALTNHAAGSLARATDLVVAAVWLVGGLLLGAGAVGLAQLRILMEESRRRPVLVRREYSRD